MATASGSSNPAASLPALCAYIQPVLDTIIKIPEPAPLDFAIYAGIHSALYN